MTITTEHKNFPGPNGGERLWRYASFTKILSLLSKRSLYFPTLRSLRRDDPFEGAKTEVDLKFGRALIEDKAFAELYMQNYPEIDGDSREVFLKNLSYVILGDHLKLLDNCYVSCWHLRQHESAALWRLYAKEDSGVAITTNADRMKKALDDKESLILGSVRYADFRNDALGLENALTPAFTKRNSYEHEHEVRLLHWSHNENLSPEGIFVECNPTELIEEIIVTPYADKWIVETVRDVVKEMRYDIPVRQSDLMTTISF